MDNITILTDRDGIEQVIITSDGVNFTSMPKSIYDTLVSNSSTPQAGN